MSMPRASNNPPCIVEPLLTHSPLPLRSADMGSSAPYTSQFLQQMVPHAVVEMIPGCGHASTVGPDELTRSQILKAIPNMPRV